MFLNMFVCLPFLVKRLKIAFTSEIIILKRQKLFSTLHDFIIYSHVFLFAAGNINLAHVKYFD